MWHTPGSFQQTSQNVHEHPKDTFLFLLDVQVEMAFINIIKVMANLQHKSLFYSMDCYQWPLTLDAFSWKVAPSQNTPGAILWNCLYLILLHPLLRKLSLYKIQTISHLQSEKSCWIDMPSPGSFQSKGLLTWTQQCSEHVKPCGSNWVKIKGAQLKINLHSPIVHWMLTKNA